MKIVGICGSPRKESSSSYLVETILDAAVENGHDGKIHKIRDLKIDPCHACGYCAEGNGCKIDDAMTDIYEEIYDCDVLIIGSPVYYGEVSAQTKTFIDRFYQFSMNPERKIKDQKLIQIYSQHNPDEKTYNSYFDHQTQYAYEYVGFKVIDRMIANGLGTQEDLLENDDIIEKAKNIGKNL